MTLPPDWQRPRHQRSVLGLPVVAERTDGLAVVVRHGSDYRYSVVPFAEVDTCRRQKLWVCCCDADDVVRGRV